MSEWNRYDWEQFDEKSIREVERLHRALLHMPDLSFPAGQVDASTAFYSRLTCDWGVHPSGARVVLDANQVLIERPLISRT